MAEDNSKTNKPAKKFFTNMFNVKSKKNIKAKNNDIELENLKKEYVLAKKIIKENEDIFFTENQLSENHIQSLGDIIELLKPEGEEEIKNIVEKFSDMMTSSSLEENRGRKIKSSEQIGIMDKFFEEFEAVLKSFKIDNPKQFFNYVEQVSNYAAEIGQNLRGKANKYEIKEKLVPTKLELINSYNQRINEIGKFSDDPLTYEKLMKSLRVEIKKCFAEALINDFPKGLDVNQAKIIAKYLSVIDELKSNEIISNDALSKPINDFDQMINKIYDNRNKELFNGITKETFTKTFFNEVLDWGENGKYHDESKRYEGIIKTFNEGVVSLAISKRYAPVQDNLTQLIKEKKDNIERLNAQSKKEAISSEEDERKQRKTDLTREMNKLIYELQEYNTGILNIAKEFSENLGDKLTILKTAENVRTKDLLPYIFQVPIEEASQISENLRNYIIADAPEVRKKIEENLLSYFNETDKLKQTMPEVSINKIARMEEIIEYAEKKMQSPPQDISITEEEKQEVLQNDPLPNNNKYSEQNLNNNGLSNSQITSEEQEKEEVKTTKIINNDSKEKPKQVISAGKSLGRTDSNASAKSAQFPQEVKYSVEKMKENIEAERKERSEEENERAQKLIREMIEIEERRIEEVEAELKKLKGEAVKENNNNKGIINVNTPKWKKGNVPEKVPSNEDLLSQDYKKFDQEIIKENNEKERKKRSEAVYDKLLQTTKEMSELMGKEIIKLQDALEKIEGVKVNNNPIQSKEVNELVRSLDVNFADLDPLSEKIEKFNNSKGNNNLQEFSSEKNTKNQEINFSDNNDLDDLMKGIIDEVEKNGGGYNQNSKINNNLSSNNGNNSRNVPSDEKTGQEQNINVESQKQNLEEINIENQVTLDKNINKENTKNLETINDDSEELKKAVSAGQSPNPMASNSFSNSIEQSQKDNIEKAKKAEEEEEYNMLYELLGTEDVTEGKSTEEKNELGSSENPAQGAGIKGNLGNTIINGEQYPKVINRDSENNKEKKEQNIPAGKNPNISECFDMKKRFLFFNRLKINDKKMNKFRNENSEIYDKYLNAAGKNNVNLKIKINDIDYTKRAFRELKKWDSKNPKKIPDERNIKEGEISQNSEIKEEKGEKFIPINHKIESEVLTVLFDDPHHKGDPKYQVVYKYSMENGKAKDIIGIYPGTLTNCENPPLKIKNDKNEILKETAETYITNGEFYISNPPKLSKDAEIAVQIGEKRDNPSDVLKKEEKELTGKKPNISKQIVKQEFHLTSEDEKDVEEIHEDIKGLSKKVDNKNNVPAGVKKKGEEKTK